jgi:hypothetical protein
MKTLMFAVMIASSSAFIASNPERVRTIDQHYQTQPSQKIELHGFSGSDIKVQSWDKNEISVKLTITFSSSRPEDEQRYLDEVALREDQSSDHFSLTLNEPKMMSRNHLSFWSWLTSVFRGTVTRKTVEGEIFVPRSNALLAGIQYGSVSLDGMTGPVTVQGTSNTVTLRNCTSLSEVKNDYGKTTIERCGGTLRLFGKSGTISIDQFKGKATLEADFSQIRVQDVTQSLAIYSASSTMTVERIGGDAIIHSNYSRLTVNNVAGFLEIKDSGGKINVKNVDGIKINGDYSQMEISDVSGKASHEISIRGQSGPVAVTNATGNVRIDNPYGMIELRNIRGNVDLDSKSARITAEDVFGDWRTDAEYSTFELTKISAKRMTITNKSGKVNVELKTVPTFVDIKNEYADVNLEIPSGFAGEVELNASYGGISTNLPSLKQRKLENGAGASGLRSVGDGSVKIAVETKSANVRVMQR